MQTAMMIQITRASSLTATCCFISHLTVPESALTDLPGAARAERCAAAQIVPALWRARLAQAEARRQLLRSCRARSDWFHGRNVQQRANLECGRNAVIRFVDAHKNVGSGEKGHFGMANFVGLPTGHHQPKRLERPLSQQFAKGLNGHGKI